MHYRMEIRVISARKLVISWDLEDQSKRCKRAVNCLLASCKCKAESEPIRKKSGVMLVHLVPDTVAELGRQAGTRDMDGTAQPALLPGPSSSNTGRYSNTNAGWSVATTVPSSNHTSDTVSQLHSRSRSIQSSWSWDQQAGMIAPLSVQPGRDSTAAVQRNLISPATGQSIRNTPRNQRTS